MGSPEAPGGGVEACGGLGNVVNKPRPLDVCLPEPQAGYWFDRLVTSDCASGLMGAAFLEILRLVGGAALPIKKGSLYSSPFLVPSLINFSALAGMDLGCDGRNRQLVYNPFLCGDRDLFTREEASLCTPLSSYLLQCWESLATLIQSIQIGWCK
jgi:hypothetical protein